MAEDERSNHQREGWGQGTQTSAQSECRVNGGSNQRSLVKGDVFVDPCLVKMLYSVQLGAPRAFSKTEEEVSGRKVSDRRRKSHPERILAIQDVDNPVIV